MAQYQLPKNDKLLYTSDSFFFSYQKTVCAFLKRNFSKDMHMQDFIEINIVTRGRGIHYIEDNEIEAKCRDVFVIPPRVIHGFKNEENFDVFHVLISKQFMDKHTADLQLLPSFSYLFKAEPLMRTQSSHPLQLTLDTDSFIKSNSILMDIWKINSSTDPADFLIQEGFTLGLISLLCKSHNRNHAIQNSKDGNFLQDEAFMKSLAYIHDRYYDSISIDMLCEISNLSRSAFLRRFKKICKMPPAEYITKIRLTVAEQLVSTTSLSLAKIAEKTGFWDASHMTKLFIKKRGISPSDYRKYNAN